MQRHCSARCQPMLLTPVVCPNDRLASVSQGDQPRACGCTLGRAGEGQPGPPPWPLTGSPGKRTPIGQHTWLRAWSSRPSAQPPFPKTQPHTSAFCVLSCLFILTTLGLRCCVWAFLGVVSGGYSISCGISVSWWLLLPWSTALGVQAQWLWHVAFVVRWHVWNVPGPGIEPVSPALAGGFLTPGSPGKVPPLLSIQCPVHL